MEVAEAATVAGVQGLMECSAVEDQVLDQVQVLVVLEAEGATMVVHAMEVPCVQEAAAMEVVEEEEATVMDIPPEGPIIVSIEKKISISLVCNSGHISE